MTASQANGEKGATALMVAASMFLLMGFAAVAIDAGTGMSERRQAQNAADFAALAALQFAENCRPTCGLGVATNNGANEAIVVVNENLSNPLTGAQWTACSDPLRNVAVYTLVSSVSPCISFTANLDQSRVVLPRINVPTSFARVIGFNSLGVTATAEAEQSSGATAAVIPFTANAPGYACLFSNQAPQSVPPCGGPVTGFFGYLDLVLYGNDVLGTPINCGNNPYNDHERVAINTALGVDHTLWEFGTGLGQVNARVNEYSACPNRSARVTQLNKNNGTGPVSTTLTNGLLGGITSPVAAPGRLTCSPSGCGDTVKGYSVDDTPFWIYLVNSYCDASGGTSPPAGVTGQVDTRAEVTACLAAWPNGRQLVTDNIAQHKRFGAVPVLTYDGPPTAQHLITDFLPVYLESFYMGCNAAQNRCDIVHSPGESGAVAACPNPLTAAVVQCGFTQTGNLKVEGVTAFVLRVDWLSPTLQEFFPGQPGTVRYGLIK